MKQSDDPKAFFEKYQFTLTTKMPHPTFKDEMEFTGLEAKYVSELEFEIKNQDKYIKLLHDKVDFLTNQSYYKMEHILNKAEKLTKDQK